MGRARQITQKQRKEEARRLYKLRDGFGWNKSQLATEWYCNHSSISEWESGKRAIPGLAIKLLEIYEKKLERFLGE